MQMLSKTQTELVHTIMGRGKGVAHLEGSSQEAMEPSSHAAVTVAYARCGLGSSPGVGPDTHPPSRSPGVDSINRVAPVTHQDQGETETPAGLSPPPLAQRVPQRTVGTRSIPEMGSGMTMDLLLIARETRK